ncbi:MAG: hypothetical protein LAO31_06550 [Acidobacteriia bacterium]|nr:hypothetical protein [Terriglobia bacterium]
MIVLLCRNRVVDYSKWKAVLDSHADAHRESGLHLKELWQDIERPENVFFVFEVDSLEKARAFINTPGAAEAGRASGVLDGEYHFLESRPHY